MKIEMGKEYQTRDGHPVRILCTDKKGPKSSCVVGLVLSEDKASEAVYVWYSDGSFTKDGYDRNLDLMHVPEEMWVAEWRLNDGESSFTNPMVKDSARYRQWENSGRLIRWHKFVPEA